MVVTTGVRPGRLVLLGSGETASTMVELHRSVLAAAGEGTSLILETPHGFQENVDSVTEKAVTYFRASVGRTMTPLRWRTRLGGLDLDRVLMTLRGARAVYAGPGSPSYATRIWADSGFADAVATLVHAGGTATFSSAAVIALGLVAMPTHEIYRGGADPYWLEGTDLFGDLTGISAAIVPHYDFAPKRGGHDASRCYIGERRLRELERQLPEGTHLIGLDEHTALVIELSARTARVVGRGGVTVRVEGRSEVLTAGTEVPLCALDPGGGRSARPIPSGSPPVEQPASVTPAVDVEARARFARFRMALSEGNADRAASTLLDLEQLVAESVSSWADSEAAASARRVIRGMVLELAHAAEVGLADPRTQLAPLVDALLQQRTAARNRRDFAAADQMRTQLADAGITVRDAPGGVDWSLTRSP